MRWLLIVLFGCATTDPEPMKATKIFYSFMSGQSTPWYLAGGIPQSTNYTIYDPASAASQAASYSNLANPGVRDAVPYNSPTWTSGLGWTGNSSNMYLDTGVLPDANTTVIVMFQNANNGRYAFGMGDGSKNVGCIPYSSTNTYFEAAGTNTSKAEAFTSGVVAITGTNVFKNGLKCTTFSTTWSGGAATRSIFLMARNNAGTATSFFGGSIVRVAIYNFKLSDAQISAVSLAMVQTFESSLDSISNSIIALAPTFYFPCNTNSGHSFLRDRSGNASLANAFLNSWVTGNAGTNGNSWYSAGASASDQIWFYKGTDFSPNLSAFNIDECSFFMNWNTENGYSQHRFIELWTNTNDYVAWEQRTSNQLTIHTRMNGVDQNISTGIFLTAGQNYQIVMFNSLSENKVGYYVDGVRYEWAKTNGGKTGTTISQALVGALKGYFNQMALFDHALSQSEVNTLQ